MCVRSSPTCCAAGRCRPSGSRRSSHHYELIGGRSPYNELTFRQARGAARTARASRGRRCRSSSAFATGIPICTKRWRCCANRVCRRARRLHPRGSAERRELGSLPARRRGGARGARRRGARRSTSSRLARSPALHRRHGRASRRGARRRARSPTSRALRLIFTAHSIPTSIAAASPYVAQLEEQARRSPTASPASRHRLAYQSRSGNPRDPWLEPDIGDALREEAARGTRDVVVVPIGFVCDHVEVLYDLDVEAQGDRRLPRPGDGARPHRERPSAVHPHDGGRGPRPAGGDVRRA